MKGTLLSARPIAVKANRGLGTPGPMTPETYETVRRMILYVVLAVSLLFGFLILRLWYLQLVKGK